MSEAADTPDRLDPLVWRTVAVVVLGPLMTQMDATIVGVSLSSIGQALHAPIVTVQWVIGGYLLALALMLPLNGWLVDRFGAKTLYLTCFSAFTLASLLCGAARSIDGLIAARLLQGLSGGLLAPMAQMMVARVAGRHMARVIGFMAMPVLLAPILGPSIAGLIVAHAGWRWLFYVNLPLGILGLVLAALLLPRDAPAAERRRFDALGFLLISPALVSLLYGLDRAQQPPGLLCLAAGVLLMTGFVLHALRSKERALVDVRLFGNRIFRTATVALFLSNGVAFAGQMLLPLFLIVGWRFSPSQAGWTLAAQGLGMLCVYPATGSLTARFGCRPVSAGGALLGVLATLPMVWMSLGGFSMALMTGALFLRGAAQGAIGVPALSASYAAVPRETIPLATTASNIAQRLGGPIATTVLALLVAAGQAAHPGSGPRAFTLPLLAMLALQSVLFCVASTLPMRIPHSPR